MIKSFKDKETEKIFSQRYSRKLPKQIQYRALKKLILLNNAENETDLIILYSNHFEH
jgi:toxin HigB-1